MPVSGANIAYASVGGLLLFSAYKGSSISNTIQGVLSGNLSSITDSEPVQWGSTSNSSTASTTAGDTGAANNTAAANQALAKSIAISMGRPPGLQARNGPTGYRSGIKNPAGQLPPLILAVMLGVLHRILTAGLLTIRRMTQLHRLNGVSVIYRDVTGLL